jgi:hypothetical protein
MPGAGPNAEQQPSQIHPIDRREDISATAARVLTQDGGGGERRCNAVHVLLESWELSNPLARDWTLKEDVFVSY